jgi:hypothetical protein
MPIIYKYDEDTNTIRTTASGKVKTGDLRDYVTKVLEDKRIKKGFIEIADFESVTELVIPYSEINQFPFVWGKYMEKGCKAVLIYAPSNLSYGIFRMLQTVISLRHKNADDLFIVIRTKEGIENKLQDLISY